ncbi:hypothetical protein [Phyllobacterium chamaecytisi]|uniref:hypothetical protein n=1 Tax=Phyllobacterium chamaecytisi TaxID=2876082 RepID=UPI001CCE2275|nr:hypothetical protein [Phyllobacterium sp. KW56]MBZ9605813.1 hypothetical protein [Phyllobacterium sp. KW56]
MVEQSPGLPSSGTVPRVRSTRTGQAAWPKVRAMRWSGGGAAEDADRIAVCSKRGRALRSASILPLRGAARGL